MPTEISNSFLFSKSCVNISHGPATAMALQHKVVGNFSEKLKRVFSDGFDMYILQETLIRNYWESVDATVGGLDVRLVRCFFQDG